MKHLVFLRKSTKGLDKIKKGEKTKIIRGGSSKKTIFSKTKKGDILYFIEKDGTDLIRCKAKVKEVINTDKLSKEEALNFVLEHQNELQLTAPQIKKWASKPYLTLIVFGEIEIIEPYKIDECSYVQMDDWITLTKKSKKTEKKVNAKKI